MKIPYIKNIDILNEDSIRLSFSSGEIGLLSRESLNNISSFDISPNIFKYANISNDGALELPINVEAQLEDGTIEETNVEFDPLMIYKFCAIENFTPFDYSMIRKIRTNKNLTLNDVASRIGVTKQFLGAIERGEVENVGVNTIKRIIDIGLEDNLVLSTQSELNNIVFNTIKEVVKYLEENIHFKIKKFSAYIKEIKNYNNLIKSEGGSVNIHSPEIKELVNFMEDTNIQE